MLFAVLFLTVLSPLCFGTAKKLTVAAECKPWRTPVHTDKPNHRYKPYFVEMGRCNGGCKNASPNRCTCEPIQTENKTVTLYDHFGLVKKSIENHLKCQDTCVAKYKKQCLDGGHAWDEGTCTCTCPTAPAGCGVNRIWNQGECQCTCDRQHGTTCAAGMTWNEESCACECTMAALRKCAVLGKHSVDLQTCKCATSNVVISSQVCSGQATKSETKLIAALVVLGVLLGVLLLIEFVLMCSKKGLIYGLVSKCSDKKDKTALTNKGDCIETGSIIDDNGSHFDYMANGDFNQKTYSHNTDPETCL